MGAASADRAVSAFSHQPPAKICMSQSSPALPNVEIEIKTNLQHDQDHTHDTVSPMSYVGNLKAGLIFALEALLKTKPPSSFVSAEVSRL